MSKSSLTIVSTESDQRKLGAQIEELYVATTAGMLDCVALGDLVAQARKIVSTCGHDRLRGGGRDKSGDGLKAWLGEFAPNVPRTTAYRFEDLANIVRDELKVGTKVNLHHVLKGEDVGPKEQKIREKVTGFIAGKSQRQILLSIGKYQAQIGGARTSTKKLTAAETQHEWFVAAQKRALTACNELHTLEERWKTLNDAVVEKAAKDAERMAKQMREWLNTPVGNRTPLNIAKYLGESTGAEAE